MDYEKCKTALSLGWAGIFSKTITLFDNHDPSPRYDAWSLPWEGFRNIETMSDMSAKTNFDWLKKIKKEFPTKFICASIMGKNATEWAKLAKMAEQSGIDAIEINMSCPHTPFKNTGHYLVDPKIMFESLDVIKKITKLPIIVKPSIDGNMKLLVEHCIVKNIKSFTLINTIKGITGINLNTFVPSPNIDGKSCIGGVSGKIIKPFGLRYVHEIYSMSNFKKNKCEISGVGGIYSAVDALEYISCGSKCCQIVTAVMEYGVGIIKKLLFDLQNWLDQHNMNLSDVVGQTSKNIVKPENLDRLKKIKLKFVYDKCVKCYRCMASCKSAEKNAIFLNKNGFPTFNKQKCIACGLCSFVCKNHCIKKW